MISMDKNSKLDATATGKLTGLGFNKSSGGSFGGQGGSAFDD